MTFAGGDPGQELVRVLLELDVLRPLVLEHRLSDQLLKLAVGEDGQLGHDLLGRLGAGQTHQGTAGQGANGVGVRDRALDPQQLQEDHDPVVGPDAVPHLAEREEEKISKQLIS